MNSSFYFLPPRFQKTFVLLGSLGLLYLIINLFVLGGDDFVFNLNSFLVSPLAILTSVLAAVLWRQMKNSAQNRLLWGSVLLGWVLWAVAESLWATYSLLGKDPYPSLADLFFLLGYIPLSVGFISRLRNLPRRPERHQRLIYQSISLAVILATTVFVFIPILQSYDSQRLLESLLSLFYPLGDLFLLLLVLSLLFTYGPGAYGIGWRMILTGFITVILSDLIFSYADWNGLYYPDSRATLVSTVGVDWLYSISYMLWASGIYMLRVILEEHDILHINYQPALVPDVHVLLFTNKYEQVVDVSSNYYRLFSTKDVRRKPLRDVLGISKQDEDCIHADLVTQAKWKEARVEVSDPSGMRQEAWISGLAVIVPPNNYSGSVIVLRMFGPPEGLPDELTEYQQSLVWNVLRKSVSQEQHQIRQFFWDYHMAFLKALFNLSLHEGGAVMSQSLLDELQSVSSRNGWALRFHPQTIIDIPADYLDVPQEALPKLVDTARHFASQLSDTGTVAACLQAVHSQFSQAVHQTAARYGDRGKHALV